MRLADPIDLMEAEQSYELFLEEMMHEKYSDAQGTLALAPSQEERWTKLLAPFDAEEVLIRILAWSKNRQRGRIVAYIEGNAIRNRLDSIAGRANWTAEYEPVVAAVPTALCRLTILGETKQNMGIGDDYKAACTDSLKRAAMEHGIGRYLAACPEVWVDLNEQGYIPEVRRTRALILHLLGYAKADIETAMADDERAEKDLRYLLYQFKSGTSPREKSRNRPQATPLALAS